MRIAYVNHGRFPTEKAHGFQIAQVCDALTELGHEVTVFRPNLLNVITEDLQTYYALRHPLRVVTAESRDAFRSRVVPGSLAFLVSMLSYAKELKKIFNTKEQPFLAADQSGKRRGQEWPLPTSAKFDCLYLRSPLLLKVVLQSSIPVILELHALPRFHRRRFAKRCNECRLVVCLTRPMADQLMSWGVDQSRICVEADGVDLRRFENLPEVHSAKSDWNLPADRPVIGYVGSLTTQETLEKGVRELIDAAATIKKDGQAIFTWIVGGPDSWVTIYRDYAASLGLTDDEVRFDGRIPASDVPSAIAACDVCVYPAPKTDHPYFLRDTSPLKLFEYLAAGRPVVCADIPPVHDVVSEESARFFRAGDAQDLAEAIADVLGHPGQTDERVKEGGKIAGEHSWEKRMGRILQSSFSS